MREWMRERKRCTPKTFLHKLYNKSNMYNKKDNFISNKFALSSVHVTKGKSFVGTQPMAQGGPSVPIV